VEVFVEVFVVVIEMVIAVAVEVAILAVDKIEDVEENQVVEDLLKVINLVFINYIDFYLFMNYLERELLTDSVYVGQLPEGIEENDLKKLFPKAKTVQVTPAVGTRPGSVFLFLLVFYFSYLRFLVMRFLHLPTILQQQLLLNKVLHLKILNLK
jgi:hypothetical protein